MTTYRLSQEIDLAWDTVWRALNKDDGMQEATLSEIEKIAIPYLASMHARGMEPRELARLILDSQELEDKLTQKIAD